MGIMQKLGQAIYIKNHEVMNKSQRREREKLVICTPNFVTNSNLILIRNFNPNLEINLNLEFCNLIN